MDKKTNKPKRPLLESWIIEEQWPYEEEKVGFKK
jgi:hypothetical protein